MAQDLIPGVPGRPVVPEQAKPAEQPLPAGSDQASKPVYITVPMLREICPAAPKNVDVFVTYLNTACERYEITTAVRIAMFLAQVGHESGEFHYTREIASGAAYEGRKDLGNTEPGDGRRYKGRGLIQVTGRANYLACGEALGLALIKHPELLETPQYATLSAGWFWDTKKLNKWADQGNLKEVTRRINGGYNGLEHRRQLYERAMQVLK